MSALDGHKQNKSIVPINHYVEPTRLAAKGKVQAVVPMDGVQA